MSDREEEKALIARVVGNRERDEAFTPTLDIKLNDLIARYEDRTYALCLRMLGEPEQAREVSQEALLTAWRRLPDFRGDSKFGTWLYSIARNLCLHHRRKRKELLTEDGVIEPSDAESQSVLVSLRQNEREEVLRQASVAVLNEQEQEAVYLRYVEGMGQDQITEMLGLQSASGARGLLQRCRRKLSRELRSRLSDLGHKSTFFQNDA